MICYHESARVPKALRTPEIRGPLGLFPSFPKTLGRLRSSLLDTEIGNVDLLRRIFVIVHGTAGISFLGIIILATKGAVRHTGDLLEREMFQKAEKNLPLSVSTASPISSQSIDSYPNLFRDLWHRYRSSGEARQRFHLPSESRSRVLPG
jgi:hypothetical protein